MNLLKSWDDVADAPADLALRRLLDRRRQQLEPYGPLSDLGCIVLVEPGDRLSEIEVAVSFSITSDPHNGVSYPDPAFQPSWEAIEHHAPYWELTYVLSDDGSGFLLIVPDKPGVDAVLLSLIRASAP